MKAAILASALVAGMTFASAPAAAHDNATLDTMKSAHGGQLRMAGPYHYELIVAKDASDARESPVIVYVTDHAGNKIPTAGASGSATVLAGKRKASAVLKPDGDNRLKGLAKYAANPDMKVLVAVTLPNKQPEQTRFTPLAATAAQAPAADPQAGHGHGHGGDGHEHGHGDHKH